MTAPELPAPCVEGAPELIEPYQQAAQREVAVTELIDFVAGIQGARCACGSTGHTVVTRHCQHPHCPMLVARCGLCEAVVPRGIFDAREHAA